MVVKLKEEDKITKEEIKKLKEFFEDEEIIEDSDMNILKQQYKNIGKDSIILAKLFITTHDYFVTLMYSLDDETLLNKLRRYLLSFDRIQQLRKYMENYGDGEELGSYYIGEAIKTHVLHRRSPMVELIHLFFMVFGEE